MSLSILETGPPPVTLYRTTVPPEARTRGLRVQSRVNLCVRTERTRSLKKEKERVRVFVSWFVRACVLSWVEILLNKGLSVRISSKLVDFGENPGKGGGAPSLVNHVGSIT